MDKQSKVDGSSRRKFIKIAAATAYVAPLIASMPAQATSFGSGSKKVTKKTVYKKFYRYAKYKKFNKFKKFSRW